MENFANVNQNRSNDLCAWKESILLIEPYQLRNKKASIQARERLLVQRCRTTSGLKRYLRPRSLRVRYRWFSSGTGRYLSLKLVSRASWLLNALLGLQYVPWMLRPEHFTDLLAICMRAFKLRGHWSCQESSLLMQ